MENQPVTLGYWKIRGLAQPIRFLLEYANVAYKEVLYEQGDGPEFSRECWLSEKFNLGLDFPNLPYFFDGDLKITESSAILRYIVKKWCPELQGKTNEDFARVEMLYGILGDIKSCATMHCYRTGNVDQLKNDVYPRLEAVGKFLANNKFLVGDYVTYVDFIFYELCELIAFITNNEIYEKYPTLKSYKENVESLERIREYIGSERFMAKPFNNKIAKI
jgi:glutathione S-transferase